MPRLLPQMVRFGLPFFFLLFAEGVLAKQMTLIPSGYLQTPSGFLLGAKLPPTRGEWFQVEAGRRDDCNINQQRNMGGRGN